MSKYVYMTKEELVNELEERDAEISKFKKETIIQKNADPLLSLNSRKDRNFPLNLECIKRFSRQLILPEFGVSGQKTVRDSSVLIVGCGGLGCPAAVYLAAAGIGTLGLVDYDEVELSNLHRQILHTESGMGIAKTESIRNSIFRLNSSVQCVPYNIALSSDNIMDIVVKYDIILDCTDNVATRYLLNDACFFAKKPLVSGSALRFEGQLTIYGFDDGPCYRCLFPEPPPPETVANCSDGGVLGVVPGIIGCLQALETLKLLVGMGDVCSKKLILFDALSLSFRSIKLRGRQQNCQLCGSSPSLTSLIDYEQFCGGKATDKNQNLTILGEEKRISVSQLKNMIDGKESFILIDVRTPTELEICKLSNCLNIPINEIDSEASCNEIKKALNDSSTTKIVCLCRRGNDSQKAVIVLEKSFPTHSIVDVAGGLTSWSIKIDKEFPVY